MVLSSIQLEDWGKLATGESGWLEIEEAWLRAVQEIYGVFCKKQQDYGPTNIGTGGEQGVAVRSGDKIARLFELLGMGAREGEERDSLNEPRRDSWLDIADYGIIGLLVHDGNWPQLLPEDAWGQEAAYALLKEMVFADSELRAALIQEVIAYEFATEIAEDLGGTVELE
jgi:hypothetical protein